MTINTILEDAKGLDNVCPSCFDKLSDHTINYRDDVLHCDKCSCIIKTIKA